MDATFQRDPEFYVFHCLSIEETWNYLDSQVRDVSWELKVYTQTIGRCAQSSWLKCH